MPFDENTGLFVGTDWSKILPPAKTPEEENMAASKIKAEKKAEKKQRALARKLRAKKMENNNKAKEEEAEVQKMLTESELKDKKRLNQKQKRRRGESHRIKLQMFKERRRQEQLDARAPTAIKDEERTYDFASGVMRNDVKEENESEGETNVKMEKLPVRLKLLMAPRFQQASEGGVPGATGAEAGRDNFVKGPKYVLPRDLKKEDTMRALEEEEEAKEILRVRDDNNYDYYHSQNKELWMGIYMYRKVLYYYLKKKKRREL